MRILVSSLLKKYSITSFCRSISKMSEVKKIAVCQMTSIQDKAANMDVVKKLIVDASLENVQMVFFPEACDFICDNKQDIIKYAEPILTGPTVKKYRELAATYNLWLSMGGVHEKEDENATKVYNTHLIINNKGDIVQTYRKLHLFDVEIPERKIWLKESDICNPGGHVVSPVETPVGNVGLAICYDMRFPELGTLQSILKANILTYPSAFTQHTGQAHWHTLLRARAIENQCYVIAAAQTGEHNAKRRSYGHALCVHPWGNVLADCGTDSPAFRIAEINPDEVKNVRQKMPVFQHRRKDAYSLYALKLRKDPLDVHSATHRREDPPAPSLNAVGNVFGHAIVPDSCVFFKSELTYAFVNLRCVTPGHVLVAPIRLVERNLDLNETEAADFFKTIRQVQFLMEKVHNAESCTVTIQDGPDAGQTVKHLHCHIMPRKKGDFIENDLIYLELAKHDQFKPGHPGKPPRSLQEMESEAKMLRAEMEKILKETKFS